MAEKRYRLEGSARPIELTEQQVDDLRAGRVSLEGVPAHRAEEHARPLPMEEQQVSARVSGQVLDLSGLSARRAPSEEHARPRVITDKDVEAMAAGKRILLEEREVLPPQGQ